MVAHVFSFSLSAFSLFTCVVTCDSPLVHPLEIRKLRPADGPGRQHSSIPWSCQAKSAAPRRVKPDSRSLL